MYVKTTYRDGTDKESLIKACLHVFSDADTSGENGVDYALTNKAAAYFGVNKNDPNWFKNYTEEELENMCTDKYMEAMLRALPDDTPEADIVQKAFDMYSETMIDYSKHGQIYDVNVVDNHIKAIAYASA